MRSIARIEAPEPTARIVISGDQAMIRTALRNLLESHQAVTVLAECDNRPEALSIALCSKPDLVLLDLDLCTRCSGVRERVGALLHAANGTPVLILTAANDCHVAQFALEQGAVGFVMKSRTHEVLLRAIRAGIHGEAWLERSTMTAVIRSASDEEPDRMAARGADAQLTRREREIVDLVVLGMQNKAIAQRLFIAETTVRHHLTSIFDKLDVTNRLQLMRHILDGMGMNDHLAPAMARR